MRRFFKVYGRVLGFLTMHRRAAVGLCVANLALAGIGFVEPMLFGHVIQGLGESAPSSTSLFYWACLGMLGIAAGMMTALMTDRLAHRLRLRAMGAAYAHVMSLPPAFHARHPGGGLMKTLWTGTDEMFALWLGLFRDHLTTALCLIGLLPVALWLNPILGGVLAALAVVFSLTIWITLHRTRKGQREAENAHTALSVRVGDVIGNAPLIQAFGATPRETASFGRLAGDVLRHQFPVLGWWAGVSIMSRASSTLATVSVVALGAWLHAQDRASMADVVTFMGFSGMMIARLESAMTTISRLGGILPRLEDFFALMDTADKVADPAGQPPLPAGAGEVAFHGVRFAYPGAPAVLKDIDFVARPGETVALVGATGSGKSTTMALLQRLWDPSEGAITVDGHDTRRVSLASLRECIGIVPQETMLLNRTIRENLLIGKPDATDAEMIKAARLAEAHDFIVAQPMGYDAIVGERGAALSGGQRQRLAIARALLRDPRILILDEATSALDGLTEQKVVRAMKSAARGRTTFVIAHRLATIRDADRILFFKNGVIAESGTFEELLNQGGDFAELARTQFPEPAEAPIPAVARAVPSHLRLVYSREEAARDQDSDTARLENAVAEAG